MNKYLLAGVGALGAFAALSASASAEIVTVTSTGTITSFIDTLGVYGTAGANLAGASITNVYTFNVVTGVFTQGTGKPNTTWQLLEANIGGGTTATTSINGVTTSYNDYNTLYSEHSAAPGELYSLIEAQAVGGFQIDVTGGFDRTVFLDRDEPQGLPGVIPLSVNSSYTLNFASLGSSIIPSGVLYEDYITYNYALADANPGNPDAGITSDTSSVGSYIQSTLTVSVTGVPETSTWAMMLLGFASLGFVGCRRQLAKSTVAQKS